jgi:hypothetical protein
MDQASEAKPQCLEKPVSHSVNVIGSGRVFCPVYMKRIKLTELRELGESHLNRGYLLQLMLS